MRKYVVASARWSEARQYWQVNVQVEGTRRSFYSSDPTRQGKREAESKAQAWADFGHGADIRLHDALDQWIEHRSHQMSAASSTKTARIIRKWLDQPPANAKHISRLTLLDWQTVIDRASKTSTQASLTAIKGFISQFVHWCHKAKLPIRDVDLSDLVLSPHRETQEKAILQPEEVRILLTVSTLNRYGKRTECWYINLFRLAVLVGLRRGEALALRWCDVDDHALRVAGSINDDGDRTAGKTKNAQRTVALSKAAAAVLADQQHKLQSAGLGSSVHVFPSTDGAPEKKPANVLREWKQYTGSNGINSNVTLHGLRHTAISLYKSDMPLALLKQVVGHSVSMDTLKQYGHQLDNDAKRSASIMDDVINTILTDEV